MKKIITVTLNPAFDLHYAMKSLEVGGENYVTRASCNAAGKGVNISRALRAYGTNSTAYLILGDENGAQFEKMLSADGICYVPLYVKGRVRENITVHPEKDKETRISLDNFAIASGVLDELYALLENELDKDTLLSFSGRIPRGVTKDEVIAFLGRVKASGARLAVDCNSLSANDLEAIRPWFIKPNEDEIAALVGRRVSDAEDAAEVACELVQKGASEQVLISLGSKGAAWSNGVERAVVSPPRIEHPRSTVGAGDSAVAGYLAGALAEDAVGHSLRLAIAFGTAACLTEGTDPPRAEDVKRIYEEVKVTTF